MPQASARGRRCRIGNAAQLGLVGAVAFLQRGRGSGGGGRPATRPDASNWGSRHAQQSRWAISRLQLKVVLVNAGALDSGTGGRVCRLGEAAMAMAVVGRIQVVARASGPREPQGAFLPLGCRASRTHARLAWKARPQSACLVSRPARSASFNFQRSCRCCTQGVAVLAPQFQVVGSDLSELSARQPSAVR